MIICGGADASDGLVKKLDTVAFRRGYQLVYPPPYRRSRWSPETVWEAAIPNGEGSRAQL